MKKNNEKGGGIVKKWSKNAIKEYGCLIIKKNLAQGKGAPKVITYCIVVSARDFLIGVDFRVVANCAKVLLSLLPSPRHRHSLPLYQM